MPGRRFTTVDVFAPEPYTGNQLAVYHDAADLDTETMQTLTRETNYSEATFLEDQDPGDGRYPVRIFDPAAEIPFAGHPTIGTAAVIREFVRDDTPDEIVLSLGVGDVPVWVETAADGTERYWMDQVEPEFGDGIDRAAAARVLGLDTDDVLDDAPLQLVSTGLPTLIVPLTSLDAAERAATHPPAYESDLIDVVGGCNLLVVTGETVGETGDDTDEPVDADLHVRVFADWADVPEDPATGSSNGCLAAYLARYDDVARRLGLDVPEGGRAPVIDTDAEGPDAGDESPDADDESPDADAVAVDVVVEQGLEMGRPSRLHLRASERTRDDAVAGAGTGERDGVIDVRVGGRVIPVAKGHLL